MGKKSSSMQADAAVFSQLQAENAALKKEVAKLYLIHFHGSVKAVAIKPISALLQ